MRSDLQLTEIERKNLAMSFSLATKLDDSLGLIDDEIEEATDGLTSDLRSIGPWEWQAASLHVPSDA